MSPYEDTRFGKVTFRQRILVVELNRPDEGNRLHAPACEELSAIVEAFTGDSEFDVAIVTGQEGPFCGGLEGPADATAFERLQSRIRSAKPVIAAVNGDAQAEGFELALACDAIVAAEGATFRTDHLDQGRPPSESGVRSLLAHLPPKRAAIALLTGGEFSAAEGVLLGFVHDVCLPKQLMPTTLRLAAAMQGHPAASVSRVKHALQGGA